jgi:hypothetical protein
MSAVSHSRVESYLTCRRKDLYGYQWPNPDGSRGIRRIRTSEGLALGSAVHECLAAFYTAIMGGETFTDATLMLTYKLAEQYGAGYENVGGRHADIETILQTYLDNEPFVRNGYEILAVEEEFRLEYDTESDSSYPFIVDLIVRDPAGRVAAVDHKTAYYLYKEDELDLMPQIPKYIAGLRALGYPAAYGIYNVLRTQKVNGGKMLKADLVAMFEQGREPGDERVYTKMLMPDLVSEAETRGWEPVAPPTVDQVLQVLEFEPSLTRITRTFEEQVGVAVEIQHRDSLPFEEASATAWRTANKLVCNHCQFRAICSEELRGGNVKAALANDFEPKPKRQAIVLSNGEEEDEQGDV